MRETIRAWAIFTAIFLLWITFFNIIGSAKTSRYLKQDIVFAAHDAALMIDESYLSDGKIVFKKGPTLEESPTFQAFIDSIEFNTGLKYEANSFTSSDPSFYEDTFSVVTFEMIDDETHTFPYVFKHPIYDIEVSVPGPSIVAVIETYGKKYFGTTNMKRITRATIYTVNSPN